MLLAAALGVILVSTSGASAFTITLDVVIVLDKTSYVVGDIVNVTLYVLDGGALMDGDSVSLTLNAWTSPATSWTKAIPLIRLAPGTYRGTFQILANMTAPVYASVVGLQAQATVGYLSDSAEVTIDFPGEVNLRDSITLSKYTAAPGETVSGTLRVYLNDQLTNASVRVTARSDNPASPMPEVQTVITTNLSIGTYGFTYSVPSTISGSTVIEVWGTATISRRISGTNWTISWTSATPLRVQSAAELLIWFHQRHYSPTIASVDIWVADTDGSAVSGASVGLTTLTSTGYGSQARKTFQERTDNEGRAPFNFSLNYTTPLSSLVFWGYAARGSANQSFIGSLTLPPSEAPALSSFVVQRSNPRDYFPVGETFTLNYTASYEGVPLGATQLFYAVHSPVALIDHGSVTTDASGRFTLRLVVPSDGASIDFSGEMPNTGWSTASDAVMAVEPLDLQMGAFLVGGTTHLTAQLPSGGAPWGVVVDFYPYNLSEFPVLRPDWSQTLDAVALLYRSGLVLVNSSNLDLGLTLPGFLPADRDYFLQVLVMSWNPDLPAGPTLGPYAFTALVHVSTGQPVEPISPVVILGVIGVPAALALVALVYVLRKTRRPQKPRPPATGEPGPGEGEVAKPPPAG